MERLNGEGVGEGARIGSQHGGCRDGGCEDEVMDEKNIRIVFF